MSEILTGAVDPAAKSMGLTPVFAGVFLLAVVGNAAELLNAVRFARKDKMDLGDRHHGGGEYSGGAFGLCRPGLCWFFSRAEYGLAVPPTRYEMWAVVLAVFINQDLDL